MNKIVAIVGMCGAGKSIVADEFVKAGYQYLRFGQITMDEIKRRGLPVTEESEKEVREGFRKKHGMAAYAILNLPKINELFKRGDVVADGLYSWSEYKVLKEKYGDKLIVVAVCASPQMRYARLGDRSKKIKKDERLRYRSFTPEEARARDYAEIENVEKGGPIAMADYTIINDGSFEDLYKKIDEILATIRREDEKGKD